MITTVKFALVHPYAIIPSKEDENAGLDIYPCFDEDFMVVNPFETKMIPTGIASACDIGYCLILKERSSTGTKGIAQRSGTIDAGFRGEIKVPITNLNDKPLVIIKKEALDVSEITFEDFLIYPYEKAICQALVVPVPELEVEEYTYEELKAIPSNRGTGMLGSSGK